MTQPAAEPKETPAASSSPKSPKPSSKPAGRTAPIPGFRQTLSTSTASDADSSPEFASAGAGPADPLSGDTPSFPEPPADDLAPLQLKKKPLAEVLRGLVMGAALVIHQSLARTIEEQHAGVWLMDEPEAAGVADPLANVANRHAGGTLVNPDAGDLIAAGVAAASYVISNAVKAFKIRRAVRRVGVHTETEGQEQAA
jgi:hypothetical protein